VTRGQIELFCVDTIYELK